MNMLLADVTSMYSMKSLFTVVGIIYFLLLIIDFCRRGFSNWMFSWVMLALGIGWVGLSVPDTDPYQGIKKETKYDPMYLVEGKWVSEAELLRNDIDPPDEKPVFRGNIDGGFGWVYHPAALVWAPFWSLVAGLFLWGFRLVPFFGYEGLGNG